MKDNLTPKEAETLEAIKTLTKEKGYPPTIREIADYRGLISHAAAYHAMRRLKDKGYIFWDESSSRTLKVL